MENAVLFETCSKVCLNQGSSRAKMHPRHYEQTESYRQAAGPSDPVMSPTAACLEPLVPGSASIR
jgi:hypothetical protein